jgi:hypothetical protein
MGANVAADGEKFSTWHLKVPPGRHQIVLKDMRSGLTRSFIVDTKIGYRYDLAFDGRGWESTRNPLDDAKFLRINGLQPNTPLIADGNGLFTDAVKLRATKELKQRAEQDARVAQQEALKAWKTSPAGKEQTRNTEKCMPHGLPHSKKNKLAHSPWLEPSDKRFVKFSTVLTDKFLVQPIPDKPGMEWVWLVPITLRPLLKKSRVEKFNCV